MLAKKVRCHVICVCFIVDIEINENIHKVDLNWGSKNVAVVKKLKEGLNLRPVVICGLSLLLVVALFLGFSSNTSKFQFILKTVDEEPLCFTLIISFELDHTVLCICLNCCWFTIC